MMHFVSDWVLTQQSPGSLKDVIQVLGFLIFNSVRQKFNPAPATNKIALPARIALFAFVALADVMAFSRFLPRAIRSRLAELRLPYRSFC